MIAAMAENRVIGLNGEMPWGRIPEDLRYFKQTTIGCPVIMGRKTFESLKKPLPGRRNIVLTRRKQKIDGCIVVPNYKAAMTSVGDVETAFIIGGESVYRDFLNKVSTIHLTIIHKEYSGDTFFPEIDHKLFTLKHTTPMLESEIPITICVYQRLGI